MARVPAHPVGTIMFTKLMISIGTYTPTLPSSPKKTTQTIAPPPPDGNFWSNLFNIVDFRHFYTLVYYCQGYSGKSGNNGLPLLT